MSSPPGKAWPIRHVAVPFTYISINYRSVQDVASWGGRLSNSAGSALSPRGPGGRDHQHALAPPPPANPCPVMTSSTGDVIHPARQSSAVLLPVELACHQTARAQRTTDHRSSCICLRYVSGRSREDALSQIGAKSAFCSRAIPV